MSGLTLQGDNAGILVKGGSPTLTGLHFDHVGTPYSGSMSDHGLPVALLEQATPSVTDNQFTATRNLFVGEDSSPRIEGNVLEGGPHILVVSAGPGTVIRGNTISGSSKWAITVSQSSVLIEDNTITDTGEGVWIDAEVSDGGPVDGPDTDVIIRGNTISGSGGNGITIDDGSRAVVEGNTITGVARSGIAITEAVPTVTSNTITGARGYGITIEKADPTVTGNTISGGTGAGAGLYVRSGAPKLRENVVERMETGLMLQTDAAPTLEANTLCGNEDNVRLVDGPEVQPDPELPGNQVCPDGLIAADAGA